MIHKNIECFGYASDIGGAKRGAALSPQTIQNSTFFQEINQKIPLNWHPFAEAHASADKFQAIQSLCKTLGREIEKTVEEKKFFSVFGGDHTSAIATWGGASHLGDLGLIWIDAHMDSHTPDTSESGNPHGMPLATLLGRGDKGLTHLFGRFPILKPENVCLIGIRSYESGEAKLLNDLSVKIFYMDEVKQRGIKPILHEAIQFVSKNTLGFGVSLDVDGIDPLDAPATGVPEPDGISGQELCKALPMLTNNPRLIGIEIVEFDPSLDQNRKTEKLIAQIFSAILFGDAKTSNN